MEIEESMAWKVWQAVPTLDEERKRKAARILADYRAQQEARGLPLWPAREAERFKLRERASAAVLNPLALDAENGAYSHADRLSPGLGDKLRKRDAAIAWTATEYDVPEQEVRDRWPLYKADLGRKWGAGPLDDLAFFDRIKADVTVRKDERAMAAEMADAAFLATFSKGDFREWMEAQKGRPGYSEAKSGKYLEAWNAIQKELRDDLRGSPGWLRTIADALHTQRGTGNESGDNTAWERRLPERELRDLLLNDPARYEKTKQVLTRLARVEAKLGRDKWFFQTMGEAAFRTVENAVSGSQSTVQTWAANAGDAVGAEDYSRVMRADVRVRNDLRRIAQEVMDPTSAADDPMIRRVLDGIAGTTAMAVTAMNPVGTALLAGGYADTAREKFLERGWSGKDADTAGLLAGVGMAAIERFSELPFLQRFTAPLKTRLINAVGDRFAARWAAQIPVRGSAELLEEFAQDLTPSVVQDAFGAVLSNVPDAQIREEAAEWIKNDLGVTALVVLPVAAITGGLAVASDLDRKSLEEWTSNPENLAILGKEKAAELAALPLEQRLPAMREAWDAQDKADRLEWLKQRAEFDREVAAAGMAIESGEKADAGRYGVAVRYDGKAWSVTLGDGSSVQADSEEAARRIRSDLMLTHRRAEADALVAAIEAWHAGKPGTDAATTLTAETVTAGKDGLTFTDRRRGVITREITNGQAVEEAAREAALLNQQSGDSEVTAIVNGSNAVQKVADGVRGVVQRLELYRGDKPLAWTFLHESLEADWQAGVQAGVFTLEGTRAAAGSLARFIDPARVTDPDERRLAENLHALARGEGDATMLRETVTEFAMRDVVGRGRYGRGDSDPGSFSRIIADAIGQAQSREEARGLSRLAAWFRSVRAWLASVLGTVRQIQKARGKQGFTEWESHMETLLGISDQGRYDAELAAEIEAQANQDTYTAREPTQEEMEAGMVFSVSPFSPPAAAKANFEKALDAFERGESLGFKPISMGLTPPVLRVSGADGKGLFMQPTLPGKVTKETHAVPISTLRGLLEALHDPVAVFQSRTRADSLLVLTEFDEPGAGPLLVAVTLDRQVGRGWSVNEVASVYGKPSGTVAKMFGETVLYENKEKSSVWARRVGQLLPARGTPSQSQGSIPGPSDVVKWVEQRQKGASPSFSLSPAARLQAVVDALEARLDADPEQRLAYRKEAQRRVQALADKWSRERWTGKGDRIRPIEEKRSPESLDNEQAMRQALREAELFDAGMALLTPATVAAYEQGRTTLEQDPLISAMLGLGRLMSKTEAARAGKLKTDGKGNAGDYDGAPWLPPSWYAGKGAGYMPDQMAQELHEAGLLKDAYPDTLWEALASAIKTTRGLNEDFEKAKAAVRAVQKQATEQARAEAAAWRKEQDAMQAKDWSPRASLVRDMRTLDAALAAMPAEVRAKVGGFVKLAQLATEKSRLDEIQRRIDKMADLLEKHLQKETREAIEELVERAEPKMEAGKKPKGSMTPEAHRLLTLARRYMAVKDAEMDGERKKIEDAMRDDADAEEMAELLERAQVLELFGGMDEQTAQQMDAALQWLREVVDTGKSRWKVLEEARLKEQQERAEALRADTGKAGTPNELQKAIEDEKKLAKEGVGLGFSLLSFPQTVRAVFGVNSAAGQRLVNLARRATSQRTDAMRRLKAEFNLAMADIFGKRKQAEINEALFEHSEISGRLGIKVQWRERKTKKLKVEREVVERILTDKAQAKALGFHPLEVEALERMWLDKDNDGKKVFTLERLHEGDAVALPLSQMQALHLTMMFRQKPEALTYHGYTQEMMEEIEAQLTDEAKAIRSWLLGRYRDGYKPLNAVFQRMYGAPLPQIANYSPLTFEGMNSGGIMTPEGGAQGMGGLSPGALKTRRNHTAKPRLEDALAVFWSHSIQAEHFKAFAEPVREMRGTLLNPDTRAALAAQGASSRNAMESWVQVFENDGIKQAAKLDDWQKLSSRLQNVLAQSVLAWNVGTLAKQSLAVLGAAYQMPGTAYARGWARLLAGKIDLQAMMKSEVIRRRVEAGVSPELRQVMSGYMAEHPGKWSRRPREFVQRGMELLGETDGFFSAVSAAIYHDHVRRELLEGGMSEAQADAEAMRKTEAMVADTAQPVELMDRSLFEVNMASNPNSRWFFMFASEARQKTALYAVAMGRLLKGKATRQDKMVLFVSHVVAPLMLQTITNIIQDIRDDDDEEWFDLEHWGPHRYFRAFLLGPLSGAPLVNEIGNPVYELASRTWSGMKWVWSDKEDAEPIERGVNVTKTALNLMSLAGAFPALKPLAPLGGVANAADQVFDWLDNAEGKNR